MKKFYFLISFLFFISQLAFGQTLLFNENFGYTVGTDLTVNGWNITGSTATPTVAVSAASISYPGYLSSGIGEEVTLATSGQDVNHTFISQTSGTIYASCLINVTSATTTGDYFFHLGASTIGTTYHGRVYIKRDASNNLAFGISRAGAVATAIFTPYDYALNTTYLLVLRYSIVAGTSNDIAAIYINPTLNSAEPVSGWTVSTDVQTDLANIGTVALRQGSSSAAAALKLDGIRVATTWTDIVGVSSSPVITVSTPTLIGFNYVVGSGPSNSQSYNLSGTNLTGFPGNITVTGSTNYEVSTDNSTFSGSVNVPYTSATLSAIPVYVRLKASLNSGTYNDETISNAGGGATTVNVTCNGSVTPTAVISVVPTSLSGFTYVFGSGPSTSQSYDLSGSGLSPASGNLTVTGTANFEISTNNSTFSASINVPYSGGALSSTPIYVRLKSGLTVGSYSSEIVTNSGGSATTQDVTCSGSVTAPIPSLPLVENFNYSSGSDLAGQNGWQIIGTDGTNMLVSDSDLSYTNYPASGGFSAAITSSRTDDLGKGFESKNSGSLYYSFLVKVTGTSGSGTYFTSLNTSPTATFYTGRVYAKTDGTNVNFGLSKSSEAATYSITNYTIGNTYLIVMKYEFVDGVTNDKVSLFIFTDPSLPSTEPTTPDVGPLAPTSTDNSSLSAILFRQASGIPDLLIDGIRVADSWNQAPLPVELTSFSASVIGFNVKLNWRTETEVNNFGFEVERYALSAERQAWEKIGFVNGNGNSNSPKSYSYEDKNVTAGKYSYRLKQIDNDGQFEYSKTIEVDFGTPGKFELAQNFPNPFNPETAIRFTLPAASSVKLTVFNLLGQEVKLLVNEYKEAGTHIINFNASDFNSGVYIYRLETNGVTQTRKMTLVK